MKTSYLRPASWPISLKVPLLVALLMFVVSAVATVQLLNKLTDLQDQHIRELSGAYLDGLSSAVLPHVLRKDIWEIYDAVDRTGELYNNVNVVSTIVSDPAKVVLAASDPSQYPTGVDVPVAIQESGVTEEAMHIQADRPEMNVYRDIQYQNQTIGRLTVQLDVTAQLVDRFQVRAGLIAGNAGLTLLLAVIGYLATMRMTKPLQILSEHLEENREGHISEIDPADFSKTSIEIVRLYSSFNAMVRAVNERDQMASRLFEEEKLASLGRLASVVAHEINNPLGGMLNTINTLQTHGENVEVRKKSLSLLERGLHNIGEVVQSTLRVYRSRTVIRKLGDSDFADLRVLLRPEIQRSRQNLDWQMGWQGKLPINGTKARQIGLNLLLNASAAAGMGGMVRFRSKADEARLSIVVENDGEVISKELLQLLNLEKYGCVPLKDGLGVGLWVVCQLVEEMGGEKSATVNDGISSVRISLPFHKKDMLNAA